MSALQIKAGKLYLDEDGFVHGPMVRDNSGPTFSAGSPASWLPDGEAGDSDATRLVSEWVPPTREQAVRDIRDELLAAERREETREDARCIALHALCLEAGLSIPAGKRFDFLALYGLIHEWVRDRRRDQSDFAEVAPAGDPTNDGFYTPVYVQTAKLDELSWAMSDLACWGRGFCAALPKDQFTLSSDHEPIGLWAVAELNIALKSALRKNA